jgi:hypothetical protein
VAQWLRHCTKNRKVAGPNPHGDIGIFHRHNSSGRTMALGSTQIPTQMSSRNISWDKGGRCVKLTTLPTSFTDCLKILGVSSPWNPQGLSRPVTGFLYLHSHILLHSFQFSNGNLPLYSKRRIMLNSFVK